MVTFKRERERRKKKRRNNYSGAHWFFKVGFCSACAVDYLKSLLLKSKNLVILTWPSFMVEEGNGFGFWVKVICNACIRDLLYPLKKYIYTNVASGEANKIGCIYSTVFAIMSGWWRTTVFHGSQSFLLWVWYWLIFEKETKWKNVYTVGDIVSGFCVHAA